MVFRPPTVRAVAGAPTLSNMGDWISQVEAAELLGVTPTSVYRMVSRGDLHPRPRHGMRPSLGTARRCSTSPSDVQSSRPTT